MAKNKDKKKIPFNTFRKGMTAGALGLAMLLGGAGMLTGCMGEKGDRGETGASGKSAYELAVENGFTGTLTEWLESLKGQSGGSGSAGSDGRGIDSIAKTGTNGLVDTYTITFTDGTSTTFTITNGENGTTPSAPEVTINAQGYWVINGVPQSVKATAEDGKTPYIEGEYWYIDGEPTGIKAQGAAGSNGKSAFELYQEQNPSFTGNLNDWLETLKGQDGKNGTSWITGAGVPSVEVGNNGDTYLDIATNYIYIKNLGIWNKVGEISGDREVTNNVVEAHSPWKGKSAVFVGDSITYGSKCDGDKYWEVLEDELELAEVTGMGVGKSCISATSTNGTNYEPLISRYNSIPEADLIQIFMGTNDYGFNTPLGTISDTTDVSFYGALNVIIPALQAKYPASRLVFVTPLHRYGQHDLDYDNDKNTAGYALVDYVKAIKEVCEFYSVPVIDLFNISGLNPSLEAVRNMYMPDGLHPNTEGHRHIANIMENYLNLYSADNYALETKSLNEISVEIASPYYPSSTPTCRLSSTYNVYLEEGQTLVINDGENFKFFLYPQTGATPKQVSESDRLSIMSTWSTTKYTATSSGWYGITMAKSDMSEFNFAITSTQTLADYFTIGDKVKALDEILLEIESPYYPSTTPTKRLSSAYNLYLEAGQTISLKDASTYQYFLYVQTGGTPVVVSDEDRMKLMSAWEKGTYTVTETGWYGVTLSKQTMADFDSSVTTLQTLADYLVIA